MKQANPKLLESGCDYLTVTHKHSEFPLPHSLTRLSTMASNDLIKEKSRGNELKPWSWQGYDGYISGAIHAGRRHDSFIVRLSSHLARERYGDYIKYATNVTRLDWQATLEFADLPKGWARVVRKDVLKYRSKHDRRVEVHLHESQNHGDSLTIGERTSEMFTRIYDKHRESGGAYPRGSIRFETEFKGDRVKGLVNQLLEGDTPDQIGMAALSHSLAKRGVFPRIATSLPYLPIHMNVLPQDLVPTSNFQKLTRWLTRQCTKSIDILRQGDKLREALNALGVSDDELISLARRIQTERRKTNHASRR